MLKKIYNLFYSFFRFYLSNYGAYSAYLAFSDNFVLNDEHSHGFPSINRILIFTEERDFFVDDSISLKNILLTFFRDLCLRDFLFTTLFNKFFFFEAFKSINIFRKKKTFSLVYNVLHISLIYYMGRFFFDNFIHMECYLYPVAFSFFDVMLGKIAFLFSPINEHLFNIEGRTNRSVKVLKQPHRKLS